MPFVIRIQHNAEFPLWSHRACPYKMTGKSPLVGSVPLACTTLVDRSLLASEAIGRPRTAPDHPPSLDGFFPIARLRPSVLACAAAIPVSSHKAVLASAVVFRTFEVARAVAAAILLYLLRDTSEVALAVVVAAAALAQQVFLLRDTFAFEVALVVGMAAAFPT